jgi:TldD protein
MTHFPIDTTELSAVLATALSRGGTYADIYFEHSFTGSISLQDADVNRTAGNIDYGAGVRVVCGEHSGYAYVEEVTPERLKEAARTAALIADTPAGAVPPVAALHTMRPETNVYPMLTPWESEGIDTRIPLLRHLEQRLHELEPRIVRVQATLSYKTKYIGFCNSLGICYDDVQPLGSIGVTCVARQSGEGSKSEQAHVSRSFRMGAEMLTDELIEELAVDAVRKVQFALTATQPKGGTMPVVMAAGAGGILLHEAIGHAFEADFNRKNESIFSDKLGQQICHPNIRVVDDGTLMHNRGSINFDDEGVAGQKTYLVYDGRLTGYLHDRISARHYGVEPTGNGRRESFRHLPIPRMRSTYMEGGTATEEELIRDVKQGIYVRDFTNGQVQIGAGDFTFFVKSGYLIEQGRLTTPVKDINIIGNGPQALADIVGVANNPLIDNSTWTCGKEGQSCPVTCGMPSVSVKALTVGGV